MRFPSLQFTTGYSMVLNLLYTRTLEEARAFLDRSFAAYLGGQGVQVSCFYSVRVAAWLWDRFRGLLCWGGHTEEACAGLHSSRPAWAVKMLCLVTWLR